VAAGAREAVDGIGVDVVGRGGEVGAQRPGALPAVPPVGVHLLGAPVADGHRPQLAVAAIAHQAAQRRRPAGPMQALRGLDHDPGPLRVGVDGERDAVAGDQGVAEQAVGPGVGRLRQPVQQGRDERDRRRAERVRLAAQVGAGGRRDVGRGAREREDVLDVVADGVHERAHALGGGPVGRGRRRDVRAVAARMADAPPGVRHDQGVLVGPHRSDHENPP
jgi:hypothetical protein